MVRWGWDPGTGFRDPLGLGSMVHSKQEEVPASRRCCCCLSCVSMLTPPVRAERPCPTGRSPGRRFAWHSWLGCLWTLTNRRTAACHSSRSPLRRQRNGSHLSIHPHAAALFACGPIGVKMAGSCYEYFATLITLFLRGDSLDANNAVFNGVCSNVRAHLEMSFNVPIHPFSKVICSFLKRLVIRLALQAIIKAISF